MKTVKTHKDLDVWKVGIELVKEIYMVTTQFPEEEKYGLTSQLRRAAVSFPSNIAEGAARISTKEFLRFLFISQGSLAEIDTQVIIAKELSFIDDIKYNSLDNKINRLGALLGGLIASLRRK